MLTSSPTKYGAGITLYGDFLDLGTVRETIVKIVDERWMEENVRQFVLALAYDLRKAKEKKRETKKLGIEKEDTVRYRGVSILWPHFLPQVALLRQYAAYRDTDHRDQACLYMLEDCAITSLLAFDPAVGKACAEFLLRFPLFPNDYLFEFCDECCKRYVEIPGKRRFHELPVLLRSMWWISEEYKEFAEDLEQRAKELGCSPQELHDKGEWPDFQW